MKNEKLQAILDEALDRISKVSILDDINELRNRYMGKKSELSSMGSLIATLPNEEKKTFGQEMNEVKTKIANAIEEKFNLLKAKALEAKLKRETIDISLPGRESNIGARNPFHIVKDEMTEIFLGMGFEVADGPEIETDNYNFELLNIPKDHPARDMQDTFYIDVSVSHRHHLYDRSCLDK